MPVVSVVSNAQITNEAKAKFADGVATVLADVVRTPKEHVHVHIQDAQFLTFGGDSKTPAAVVTVQASSAQILEENRKLTVDALVPLLKDIFGCEADRTTTFFVDHPVENIAVGTQIIQFASPRSPHNRNPHF